MNWKRFILATITVWAVVFVCDWVIHGYILSGMYQETANLWRTTEDMQAHFRWLTFGQFLFSVMLTYIFTQGYESKGPAEGVRYGLWVGLLFTSANFVTFAVQPIPFNLALFWSIGTIAECMIAGVTLTMLYKSVACNNPNHNHKTV